MLRIARYFDTMVIIQGGAYEVNGRTESPEFELPSHLNEKIQLKDYLGKTIVLVFFPWAWTPI